MIRRSISVEVDVNVEYVIDCLSDKEKEELCQRFGGKVEKKKAPAKNEDFDVVEHLSLSTPWELKKLLCTVLGVPTYYDEVALRERLEEIIKAG